MSLRMPGPRTTEVSRWASSSVFPSWATTVNSCGVPPSALSTSATSYQTADDVFAWSAGIVGLSGSKHGREGPFARWPCG